MSRLPLPPINSACERKQSVNQPIKTDWCMTLMASRRKLFLIGNDHGDLFGAGSGFLSGLLCRIMLWAVKSLWLLLCEVLLWPFGSVSRYISSRTYREGVDGSERNERSYHLYDLQAENREASASLKETYNPASWNIEEDDHHIFCADEGEYVLSETSWGQHRFSFGSGIDGFVEEPKIMSFIVQEKLVSYVDATNLCACNFSEESRDSLEKVDDVEETESDKCSGVENEPVAEEEIYGNGRILSESLSGPKIQVEANIDTVNSFTDEVVLEANEEVYSCTDEGFVWLVDEGTEEDVEEQPNSEESCLWEEDVAELEGVSSGEELQIQHRSDEDDDGGFVEKDLQEVIVLVEKSRRDESECRQQKVGDGESGQVEYNDRSDLSSWWKHDEIIEQLRQELKAARTGGLPTILEEPELEETDSSPTKMADVMMESMKMTDQKLGHKSQIMEIQEFYKSYAERMRKLDVSNYQTMHAIGILHLKDPLKSNATHIPSSPLMKSHLSQNLWPTKLRRSKIGPAIHSMEAFYQDLEMIYVGQVCLSWEILQWECGKCQELLELDPHGSRQYTFVASEIQFFQVLLRRFIENEPFQGPRIENYVKTRCVVRSLLQVPALKDDSFSFSEKKARVGEQDDVPTAAAVMQLMEETIRLFWDFIRSDKEEGDCSICKKRQLRVLDSDDMELLKVTRNQLKKKERKLKGILRSGNCIVKRLQKHRDRGDEMLMLVSAQVELRLISRVLNMAKVTREQFIWCREKLERISFISRKIYAEPSFLLFPC